MSFSVFWPPTPIPSTDFPLLAPNGSAGAPAYSFSGDPTSGIFERTAGEVNISAAGSEVARFNTAQVSIFTNYFQLGKNVAAEANLIFCDNGSGTLEVFGGTANLSGGGVMFYGAAHATKANQIEFYNSSSLIGNVISGAWMLGASSSTPQHSLNTSTATPASGIGTLTNLPAGSSGNPTGFIQITINGSTRNIPFW